MGIVLVKCECCGVEVPLEEVYGAWGIPPKKWYFRLYKNHNIFTCGRKCRLRWDGEKALEDEYYTLADQSSASGAYRFEDAHRQMREKYGVCWAIDHPIGSQYEIYLRKNIT